MISRRGFFGLTGCGALAIYAGCSDEEFVVLISVAGKVTVLVGEQLEASGPPPIKLIGAWLVLVGKALEITAQVRGNRLTITRKLTGAEWRLLEGMEDLTVELARDVKVPSWEVSRICDQGPFADDGVTIRKVYQEGTVKLTRR